MRKTIALVMLALLLVPYAAFAGQLPGVQDSNANVNQGSALNDNASAFQDTRGRVSWANNLFWYQLLGLYRWATRWAHLGITF